MLVGAVLGIIIALLVFVILYLLGFVNAQRKIIAAGRAQLAEADGNLQRLAGQVQHMQKPIEFKFSDDQVMTFANTMLRGVERLQAAENGLKN